MSEPRHWKPTITVCSDADQASLHTARLFAEAIGKNPKLVLGLATGGTPVATYRELVRMHRDDNLDFAQTTTFNLDEYVGLAPDHPQSYRMFMQQQLFDHINIDPSRTNVPDGLAVDVDRHAGDYEQRVANAGGVDLQLLGIGHNGHIAFNEPGSPRDSRTRQVDLTERTVQSNARFFDSIDDVPRTAITMGIGTILEAKRIVLLAIGESKAAAVRLAVEGKIDADHPASFLQTHPDVTYVLDAAAASGLTSI
ncbi:MAG: glucosamine-6-phosphate deaminase [Pirellulaceae bacterium]|nr:glucosamine-6-phosphate deaminase [Pirellulaceae bacterium]